MAAPATLFDKIWASHAILARPDGATLLHIDRHLVHDGSSNAFRTIEAKGLTVRRPDRTFATPDHYVSTLGRDLAAINAPHRRSMVEDLDRHAAASGVTLFGLADRRQGIVHVVGPEQGLSQPGMVIVCDGTAAAARRIERVLWNDPATGVMRHADAGYEEAIACARERGLKLPFLTPAP